VHRRLMARKWAAIWTLRDLAKLTAAERMCLESY
jgi:hypothetical protein